MTTRDYKQEYKTQKQRGEQTEVIACPRCKEEHAIEYWTSKTLRPDNTWSEPVPSKLLGFYKCQGKLYLGTVEGKKWK